MRRGASLHEKRGHEYRVVHTPAHRSQAAIDSLPGPERRIAIGNQAADTLAMQALLLHPQASPVVYQAVSDDIDKLVFAAKVMAKVLCVSPSRNSSGPSLDRD
eukprot:8941174-Pyramimonas_sp.AAC.1